MNIRNCSIQYATDNNDIVCPKCGHSMYRRHGCYVRKGFHAPKGCVAPLVKVCRYRCLNPACPRRTFSILPHNVIRYCRFFWPYLLALLTQLTSGKSSYYLARYVWDCARAVIVRAATLLGDMQQWVEQLCRELTDGEAVRGFEQSVKIIIARIGRHELNERWYLRRYARGACRQRWAPHNLVSGNG